ncbi:MAG: ComEC/Rec2 family competence protein, partial [bacterium]|nr:ComEC/Rec2 family competence protein [bacterium]
YCLAWLAGVPGRWRGLAVLPLLWVYALMVGLASSVVRAMLMFTVFAAAPLVRRMHNGSHTLLVAAFMYVLIAPADIASLGTQLTFLSVFALIMGMPPLDILMLRLRWVRGPAVYDLEHRATRPAHVVLRYFVQIACGTMAIWALTWPIIVTKNNMVTPCSWLANLIVVPLLTVVLALGFITLVVSLVSASLAALVQVVNLGLLHGMLRYMDLISSTALSHFVIKSLTPAAMLCYYLALAVTWWWLRHLTGTTPGTPRARRAVAWSMSAAWLIFWLILARDMRMPQALRIVMLDVGLGDVTVVHGRGGETLVIDGGVRHALWSAGARILVPYLHCMGVNTVDALICSHFDRDHCGGLYDVLEMTRVREVLVPPLGAPSPQADELRAMAAARGTPWRTIAAGATCVWRTITACALHPPQAITGLPARVALRSDNTWSLVMRISDGARTFLATGDATLLSEALQLHAGYAVRSDVLKLAHHGSASSSSPQYLAAVQPALATLSVGRNGFGLPADAVLDRLRAAGIPLLRTDQSGAILVELRPRTISMYTFDGQCTK